MATVIVRFNMIHADVLANARGLININHVVIDIVELSYQFFVALEVHDVHFVKPEGGGGG